MAQRIVELLIGRLVTDEQFRAEFIADPAGTLVAIAARGFELTPLEAAALVNTNPTLWAQVAESIDPRLQKASLISQFQTQKESDHV